jgi:hypothetical protein
MKRLVAFTLMLGSVVEVGTAQTGSGESKLIRPQKVQAATVIDESKLIRAQQLQTSQGTSTLVHGAPPASYTIPAGTRILARLTSPLRTTSATEGSGVYLETQFPIVVNDRVVVPPKTFVLGSVLHDRRPGRVRGRAQFRFQFDTMVLPNNHTVSIEGSLQDLPGSPINRRIGARGRIEPVDQIDRDVPIIVKATLLGGVLGLVGGQSVGWMFVGGLAGGAAGTGKTLFSRGDEIFLPAGTPLEIVLDSPVTVEAQYVP